MRLFALVDCSAFYCSCERSFRPDLRGKPVVVLSNNDGCVIARTSEAKALGVEMGAPYFQVRELLKELGVEVFSSNYVLYADMSRRVMSVVERFAPEAERYSIDEAFVVFDVNEHDVEAERRRITGVALEIRHAVKRATGIPVRVSVAETKTLAKVGSEYSKALLRHGREPCVCFWEHPHKERFLEYLPVTEVWGIGKRWGRKLARLGATSAAGLARLPDELIRRTCNVLGLRTALELRGLSCIPLERFAPPRKSIVRSRMFGEPLSELGSIAQAVAAHTARAAEKLRSERLTASSLEVFVSTGRHGSGPLRQGAAVSGLRRPTNDSIVLAREARRLLAQCFVPHDRSGAVYRYKKAGVMMLGLLDERARQADLFQEDHCQEHAAEHPEIMEAVDRINRRFGKHTVVLAASGSPRQQRATYAASGGAAVWGMKRERMSPRYTTVWEEIPVVGAR